MAASITIGSLSLASDGRTLTGTLSGGTGTGYGPASGVTGFTVHATVSAVADLYPTSSVTISGTTVTLTISAIIPSGATVTVDLGTSATSNITDSGANTPTGQSGVACTNNSTQAFSFFASTNAAFVFSPGAAYNNIATGRWDFSATGTDAQMPLDAVSNGYTLRVTVDGTTTVLTIPSGGTNSVLPIFFGLTDTSHRVSIRYSISTSGGAPVNSETNRFLYLKGSSPAVSTPTDITPQYDLNNSANNSHVIFEGLDSGTGTSGGPPIFQAHSDCVLRLRTNASTVLVWDFGQTHSYKVALDGGAFGAVQSCSFSGYYDYMTISTGISDGQFHDVEIRQIANSTGANGGWHWYRIATPGGTLDTTKTWTQKERWLFVGDSTTEGNVVTDSTGAWAYKLGQKFGVEMVNAGFAGSAIPWSIYGAAPTGYPYILSPAPTKVFVWLGHNNGAFDATFISNYETLLNNLITAYPSAKIYCIGYAIKYPSNASPTTSSACDSAVQTSFNSIASGNKGFFISPSSTWYPLLIAGDINNWVHYNPSGYDKQVNWLVPMLSSTGYTVSGPASGPVGSASSAFTVTIATGATFAGTETVTLSDGGNGGTFTVTAAGGSVSGNNTGNPTVTPAAGATNFTYTYTAATSGAKSLAGTNAQGWTDASPATYTATAGGGGLPPSPNMMGIGIGIGFGF